MPAFPTNLGSQILTFRFKQKIKGREFNRLLRGGIEAGVSTGFALTPAGGGSPYNVVVGQGTLYVKATDASNDKLMRLQTQASITIPIAGPLPHIEYNVMCQFGWYDLLVNYCEVFVSTSPPTSDQVLLGKVSFVAGGASFHSGYPRSSHIAKTWTATRANYLGDPSTLVQNQSSTLVDAINGLADGGTYT
jgi:hypothetical protein